MHDRLWMIITRGWTVLSSNLAIRRRLQSQHAKRECNHMAGVGGPISLEAGWRRAKADIVERRTFVRHPFAVDLEGNTISKISQLLNLWCTTPSRGIPQGHSASDVLAKFYLAPVDHNLREKGSDHLRYVDDFRIFCSTFSQARAAILELSRLLRIRGLSVQSAKLQVLRADAARSKFEGVQPIIAGVSKNYLDVLIDVLQIDHSYVTLADAEAFLNNVSPADIPMDIIYKVFNTYFNEDDQVFHKSLFHFILNRLANANDTYAVRRIVHYLTYHPEESAECLEYLVKVDGFSDVDDQLVTFIRSAECVYEYQVFQIVDALARTPHICSAPLRTLLIETAFDAARPAYVRAAGRRYLLTHGGIRSSSACKRPSAPIRRTSGRLRSSVL